TTTLRALGEPPAFRRSGEGGTVVVRWFRRRQKTTPDAAGTHAPQTPPPVSRQPTPAPAPTPSPPMAVPSLQTQPASPAVAGRKPGSHLADQNGLTPPELLMLSYAPGYTTDTTDFQGFWEHQYGITAPGPMLTDLVDRGFLIVGGPEQAVASQTG